MVICGVSSRSHDRMNLSLDTLDLFAPTIHPHEALFVVSSLYTGLDGDAGILLNGIGCILVLLQERRDVVN